MYYRYILLDNTVLLEEYIVEKETEHYIFLKEKHIGKKKRMKKGAKRKFAFETKEGAFEDFFYRTYRRYYHTARTLKILEKTLKNLVRNKEDIIKDHLHLKVLEIDISKEEFSPNFKLKEIHARCENCKYMLENGICSLHNEYVAYEDVCILFEPKDE